MDQLPDDSHCATASHSDAVAAFADPARAMGTTDPPDIRTVAPTARRLAEFDFTGRACRPLDMMDSFSLSARGQVGESSDQRSSIPGSLSRFTISSISKASSDVL